VVISELHEGTFFAQIHIQSQGNSIELDARPSDAIALAIRFQAPVYVAEEVLHEAGIEADDIRQETEGKQTREPIQSEGKTHPPLNKMDQLEQELKIAIETENYEKAASIRDKINQLKG
jgi:bifunctional DNase/RNase